MSFSFTIFISNILFVSKTSFVEYIVISLFNFSNTSVLQWSGCLCVIRIISTLFHISKYSSLYFNVPGSINIFFPFVYGL